jgi:hypothetical protein
MEQLKDSGLTFNPAAKQPGFSLAATIAMIAVK